jgi:hypothetical protein
MTSRKRRLGTTDLDIASDLAQIAGAIQLTAAGSGPFARSWKGAA